MTLNNSKDSGRRLALILMLMVITIGCRENKQIRGSQYVPRDVMVDMMVDMHLIDGITNDVKFYRKYNPQDSIDLYGAIFLEYRVDREKFYNTLSEYSANPMLLDQLYNEVLMELNLMQDQLDKDRNAENEAKAESKKQPIKGTVDTKRVTKPTKNPQQEK